MKDSACLHFPCAGPGAVMQGRSQISPTPRVAGVFALTTYHQDGSAVIAPSEGRDSLIRGFLKEAAFLI